MAASADPVFTLSTFDADAEGWQPWSTSTTGGITENNPYLHLPVDGAGQFGRMIAFHSGSDWTGDYISTGVDGLRLHLVNRSTINEIHLRLAIGNRASPQQPGGTWWLSRNAIIVPTQSEWAEITLPIAEQDFQVVGNLSGELGTDSFEETLSNVQNLRILSAVVPLGAIGDEFIGDVGLDNIALIPEPTSAFLLLSGCLVLLLLRRR